MTSQASAVLIVGAGPRLGSAIARELGGQRRPVGLVARRASRLAEVGEQLRRDGLEVRWAAADVGDRDALTAAIGELANQLDAFDVAVHNVSVWRDGGALHLSPDQLFADLAVGATSLLTIAQAVGPGMIERGTGTILATGSMAADQPSPEALSLGMQKSALRTLVHAMAGELGPHGVHCATVTINGTLGDPGFDPDGISPLYRELVDETAGRRDGWRTVVDYPGR